MVLVTTLNPVTMLMARAVVNKMGAFFFLINGE